MAELRRSPLETAHEAAGAKLVPFAGWRMPLQYSGIVAEHTAVRASAGVFDVSHMGQLRVVGADAPPRLQRILSNDLARLASAGDAQYSMLLDERAGIEDDLIVYRIAADELLLVVNAANRSHDAARVRHAVGDAGTVNDETDRWAMLALQGPVALDVVAELGLDLRDVAPFRMTEGTVAGLEVLAATTGYTGERGCELLVDADDGTRLWDAILGDSRVVAAGLGARDTLRLEACYPLHGNDIDTSRDPIGAGLGFAAPPGLHAAVDVLRAARPAVRLVPLLVDGPGIPRTGCEVLSTDGTRVGSVSSGTMSPTLRQGIALAWVDAATAPVGTQVQIDVRGRGVAATVVRRPFVRGSL